MRKLMGIVGIVALAAAGCGSNVGGGSIESRCDDWCARRNADTDCLNMINCAATCPAFAVNATITGCETEARTLLSCFEASSDICAPGGTQVCGTENTTLVTCQTADLGP